jgi:hypothetical protein
VGERRGRVGAADGGGAHGGGLPAAHLRRHVGEKEAGDRWWRRGFIVVDCIAPGVGGGGAQGGVGREGCRWCSRWRLELRVR